MILAAVFALDTLSSRGKDPSAALVESYEDLTTKVKGREFLNKRIRKKKTKALKRRASMLYDFSGKFKLSCGGSSGGGNGR